jgi:hypothetical protein
MLKNVAGIAAAAVLLLVAGAHPARAMTDDIVIKAHVPFAFEVDGSTMPAGNYEVRPVGINEPSLLKIQSTDGHGAAGLFLTTPQSEEASSGPAEMVFDRVDGQRFLRAIRLPGERAEAVPLDPAEVQAARAEGPSATRTASRS